MAKHLLTFTLDDSIFSVSTQGGGAMFFSTKPENIFHQFLLEKSGRTDYNFFHLSGKYIFGYITAPHLKVTFVPQENNLTPENNYNLLLIQDYLIKDNRCQNYYSSTFFMYNYNKQ
jgi:hypothetical protein